MNYYELLKHPNWQKKRLEVLNRAGFECEDCGEGENTLHVHHGYYEKNTKPWDYPDKCFHCLCEECHQERHNIEKKLRHVLGAMCDLERVYGYALAVKNLSDSDNDKLISLENDEQVLGWCEFYLIKSKDLYDFVFNIKNRDKNTVKISVNESHNLRK